MKRLAFLLFTLLALGSLYCWQRRLPDRDVRGAVALVPSRSRVPSVTAEDVDLKIRAQGKLVWQLTIQKAQVPTDGSDAWVTGLKRGVYYRNDKPYFTITAGQLHYNPNTQNIVVSGDIALHSTDGLALATEELRWDKQLRRVLCPGVVQMQLKDVKIETQKVFFYPDKKTMVCPNAVRVALKHGHLRGDTLVANLDTEQVDIMGNVEGALRVKRRAGLAPSSRLTAGLVPSSKLDTSKHSGVQFQFGRGHQPRPS